MSYNNMNAALRRAPGGTKAAANGTVPRAGRVSAASEGAAIKPDAETGRGGGWETLKLRDSGSPSLRDGFHGAGDAATLGRYATLLTTDEDLAEGIVVVQATPWTREMLHRAGILRVRTFDSYRVSVVRDRFNRLQLAAVKEVA